MTLYMSTTQISAARTVSQIQEVLGRYGAQAVLVEYAAGEPDAMSFRLTIGGKLIPFRLPCRWEAIMGLMEQSSRRLRTSDELAEKAKRIAWRQVFRWVEAQMALVQTTMVKIEEVFLPYVQLAGGQTLFEKMAGKGFQLEDKR